VEFHSGDLPLDNLSLNMNEQVFPNLEELYFAFNEVLLEEKLFYPVTQLPSLKYLVITGNPFAL
jgi:Leucine-rich repeat (LRR) protein